MASIRKSDKLISSQPYDQMTEATSSSEPKLLPGGFHPFTLNTDSYSTLETNHQRPNTDAILTIRVIKSFQFRTMKALVLKVDLTQETVKGLKERCVKGE